MKKEYSTDCFLYGKDKNEVYFCVTLYHLFVSLVLINIRNSKNRSILVLTANDHGIYCYFKEFEPYLLRHGYKVNVRFRNKFKNLVGLELLSNRVQFKQIERLFEDNLKNNYLFFNFAWNFQYVYSTAEFLYKKCSEAVFVEEASLTAFTPNQSKIKEFLKRISGASTNFYKDNKVKFILVQKGDTFPKKFESKLSQFNLVLLCKKLSEISRKELLSIFLKDCTDRISFDTNKQYGIIFSQCFSEDRICDEGKKIEDLRNIVSFYSRYAEPIIKIHPRDLSDYGFRNDYIVLPRGVPSEILLLMNCNFLYAIGINTSSVYTTDAKFKIVLNENFNEELSFKMKNLGDFESKKGEEFENLG